MSKVDLSLMQSGEGNIVLFYPMSVSLRASGYTSS